MRRFILLTCLATVLSATAAPQIAAAAASTTPPSLRSERVLLRSHFVGGTALKNRPEAARWAKMAATNTAFTDLLKQTAQKLATTPFRALQPGLPAGAKDHADLLQPLFDDLLTAESWIEWRGTATTTEQLAVAIRLPDARATAWSTALTTVAKSWSGQTAQTDAKGWQVRLRQTPNLLGFARVGEWVVIGLGQEQLKLWSDFQTKLSAKNQPFPADAASWLDLRTDWPLVQPRLPLPLPFNAPETHFTLTGEGGNLRLKGTLVPEKALTWKAEAWQTPTNFIRDPLISFTAMRGVSALFNENSVLRSLGLGTGPSQIFLWGMDGVPFRTYAAAPYRDAAKVVRQAAAGITNRYNPDLDRLHLGSLSLAPTNPIISWQGLPFIMPHLGAAPSPQGEMLIAGLSSNSPKGEPPPKELLRQFEGRKDLAYYDWEVTEPRLGQWRGMAQLFELVGQQPKIRTNMAAVRWLTSIQKGLGETVTEITVASPRELKLTRKAPMGLNAVELTYLATWLESTNFPFSPFVTPQLPTRPSRPPGAAKPPAPNAPPGR
jgi:hypothetical protein